MIKNRSFMLGLGFGLAGGALLLQLMISAGMATPTKAQIVREASKLNLKVTGADDKLLTAEEWKKLSEQNEAGTAEGGAPASGSQTPTNSASPPAKAASPSAPSTPLQPGATGVQKPSDSAEAVPPSSPAADKPVSSGIVLRIPNGVTLTEVADLLAGAGVIKDKDLFIIEAKSRRVQTKIQSGLYRFIPGQSNDAIIGQLIMVRE
ncbi:hypothetical protein G5B47_01715 [Paenibacillus sp. 7124]|uniref:Aminodeoxychorismate lyase n=1 Tax=Paenibacillus apii TaxID=1850370 RepID=A0A6M1PGP8_9BACL|nr:hypothetical protein [Paenibacillus apii]NGM81123.1 hypothetical protein [Paenibacillus apii]NJJ37743.1 hypothetical protein [Paenibacillus apii]